MRLPLRLLAVVVAVLLVLVAISIAAAEPPANEHFQRTWARTDQPVLSGSVARTWIWGPDGNTSAIQEPYAESPGGTRMVQYFDKSRMEINNPDGDPASPFYVTNGLLVVELMTGQLQLGHDQYEPHAASTANVAGDQGDPGSPTYAELAPLRSTPAVADGSVITQRIDGNGVVTSDSALDGQNVTAASRVTVPGIDHQVASPFWEFLNSSGPVVVNGQTVNQRLFDPWFYATGYPITEAYWADVSVAGTVRLVLMQCFERRCLTYTPGNPPGFVTEAGNVGQHYHAWRYEQIVDPGAPPPGDPMIDYEYVTGWGGEYTAINLRLAIGVTVDQNDNLWVANPYYQRLVQFDEHGVFLRTLVIPGLEPSFLNGPRDVAISEAGDIYVVDGGNDRVQVYDPSGEFLFQWGVDGSGPGQFDSPNAIGIHNETVYVNDSGNSRIQMFNLAGQYQTHFGSLGLLDGQFRGLRDLAIDAQGNLYVTDATNNRVQKFSGTGQFLGKFGGAGSTAGLFSSPDGIDLDNDGNIFVADLGNNRVQKFDSTFGYLTSWGTEGAGRGQLSQPRGLAVDNDGDIYVADRLNNRIQKFTNDGAFLFQIKDDRRGRFTIPVGIAVLVNGDVLVADSSLDLQTISRHTSDGIPLEDYSFADHGASQYERPDEVVVNAAGQIFVADSYGHHIKRFSSTWAYLGAWGSAGTGPGQFNAPRGIATDADGNFYIADSGNNRIQKFDANGVFLRLWGGFGTGDGQFSGPEKVAVGGDRVYVADNQNNRVQIFDLDGNYLGQWGSAGSGIGELLHPTGIAVTPSGHVLVVEYGNDRVQVFSPTGEPLGSFGSEGSGPGQFREPFAIAVDEEGYVYVTDIGSHRVQKFAPVP